MSSPWDSNATVRRAEHPPQAIATIESVWFPDALFPALTHPRMRDGDPAISSLMGAHRLLLYLDFTTALEALIVNPVALSLGLNESPIYLSPAQHLGAWQLYTDEAFHALNAVELAQQVSAHHQIPHQVRVDHQFRTVVEAAQAEAPGKEWLVRLCSAVVSETLISGTLERLPRDPTVNPAVREVVRNHEQDERRHHAYFSKLFDTVWHQLPYDDQLLAGPLLADFIVGFLSPDWERLIEVSANALQDLDLATKVVRETAPSASELRSSIRHSARATLSLFERNGLLDVPRIEDRFGELELLKEQS